MKTHEILRTFVAIPVPPELTAFAARLIQRLRFADAKVTWTRPDQMHWTLSFLGDVSLLEVPEICRVVEDAARNVPPFDVELRGVGAFPDLTNPRTIWMGLSQGHAEMCVLHDALAAGLTKLGYRPEARRFQPHLTIGRIRSDRSGVDNLQRLLEENAAFEGGITTVYEINVMSSILHRDGPEYESLGHADLGGQR
jgi:2'-5' RNA ligase